MFPPPVTTQRFPERGIAGSECYYRVGLFGALSTLFRPFLELHFRDMSWRLPESGNADSEFY